MGHPAPSGHDTLSASWQWPATALWLHKKQESCVVDAPESNHLCYPLPTPPKYPRGSCLGTEGLNHTSGSKETLLLMERWWLQWMIEPIEKQNQPIGPVESVSRRQCIVYLNH